MNILANSINIFEDKDIVKFLALDYESMQVQALRVALGKNIEFFDKISGTRSQSGKQESAYKQGQVT
jgi:hypothetical protein